MSNNEYDNYYRRSHRLKGFNYSSVGYYFITICTKDRQYYFGKINNNFMILTEIGKTAIKCWFEIPLHYPNVVLDEFIVMPNHMHGILQITPVATHHHASTLESEKTHHHASTLESEKTHHHASTLESEKTQNHVSTLESEKTHHHASTLESEKTHHHASTLESEIMFNHASSLEPEKSQNLASENPQNFISGKDNVSQINNELQNITTQDCLATTTQGFASVRRLGDNNKFGPQSKNLSSIVKGYKIGVKKYATMNKIDFFWQSRFYDRIIRDRNELNRIRNYIINNPAKWQRDRNNLEGLYM